MKRVISNRSTEGGKIPKSLRALFPFLLEFLFNKCSFKWFLLLNPIVIKYIIKNQKIN